MAEVSVFGIRHHGPGCARALLGALEAVKPDCLLVEGPADAQSVLAQMGPGLVPPVAILVYAPEDASRAAYYPFARFSPEWNALQWAHANGVPVRFMDLPRAFELPVEENEDVPEVLPERVDPLGILAETAGYSDRELWWEHQVEQRQDAAALFTAILEAMGELRAAFPVTEKRELLREAHMRQTLRAVNKEGFERVAVVCGAWHAPAIADPGDAKADAALLKGLTKTKTAATWIPWTHSRLAYQSGYGAGVRAPGWYCQLWDHPDQAAMRWIAEAARLLRSEDLDASVASVVETQRLAEALAALRGAPVVGLPELMEAIESVLCQGQPERMMLIRQRLEAAEALGEVPAEMTASPLQRDLEAEQKRLRLKVSPDPKALALDLREPNDRAKSVLLHRLQLLEVPWGVRQPGRKTGSTFHEDWKIAWQPEFVVSLIAQSIWGMTIVEAATGKLRHEAANAPLPTLTALLDACLLADLPGAAAEVLVKIQDVAALSSDVGTLMDALPPLARVARYGDVRGTQAEVVLPILEGLVARIVVGVGPACGSLDDDAALRMTERFGFVQQAIDLVQLEEEKADWQRALLAIAHQDAVHGRVRGAALRLLLVSRAIGDTELVRYAGLALSPANPPAQAAKWVEGLVAGSGMALVHLDGIWRALDTWLVGLGPEAFVELVPLLRRAFSGFDSGERRAMGEKVRRLGADVVERRVPVAAEAGFDRERAERVVPVLIRILGGDR